MREAASSPAPAAIDRVNGAYAVLWFENSIPRARVWLYNIEADTLFRELLRDQYLLEGADLTGRLDADLEFRSGQRSTVTGQLKVRDATMRWTDAEFALSGIRGRIPYERTIGAPEGFASATPTDRNIRIRTMMWADKPLASALSARASYRDRVLRFDDITLDAMGGKGVGTVVSDHRGQSWRMASMLSFENVQLQRLHELLPGLPILARVTRAELDGRIGLIYTSPGRINISGSIVADKPGVIEISPKLHERIGRGTLPHPVIEFQQLRLDLIPNPSGQIEAKLDLYRRTAQSIKELARGVPFTPHVLTIKFPLLPFVSELSQDR